MAGKFELKKSKNDKFYFSLLAGNGQTILSSEMYEAKASAVNGIESVKKNAGDAGRYEKAVAKNGAPYFNLKAANGQVIGTSEMYSSESARDGGIESVMKNAPDASVDDQTVA
ncbi:MAG: YegP family protein [Pseudomonadota bacterium]|nr:YegP family protein [Pseudomonadota bacterium]